MARDTNTATDKEESAKVKNISLETIEGNMSVIPNPDYRAKEVYALKGLGSIFSGNYYVRKARHVMSGSGDYYSVEMDVINVDHVKVVDSPNGEEPVETLPPSEPENPVPASSNQRMYHIVKGDTLSGIARKFYGSGSRSNYMKIFNANQPKIKDPNWIYAGDWIVIP